MVNMVDSLAVGKELTLFQVILLKPINECSNHNVIFHMISGNFR